MWGDYRRWKQFDTNEGRWGYNFWRINKNLDRLIEALGPVICFAPYRSKLYKCREEQARQLKRWRDLPQRGRLPIDDLLYEFDVVFSAFMRRDAAWLDYTTIFDYDPEDDYDPNFDEAAYDEWLKQISGTEIEEQDTKGKRRRE